METTGDGVSTLEHLAELDRLLRDVQVELGTGREPAPALPSSPPPTAASPPPTVTAASPVPAGTHDAPDSGASRQGERPAEPPIIPTPAPARQPASEIQVLTRLTARLVTAMRELLDGYEQVLVPLRSADAPRTARSRSANQPRSPATSRGIDPDVTVSAGPFASVEALRAFEQSVARLPGVREVAVRGYEGADRAIIEVRLDHASP